MNNQIIYADAKDYLQDMDDNLVDMIYIDPPFNTGKIQKRARIKTKQSDTGDRVGFGGKTYDSEKLESGSFTDNYPDYLGFLLPLFVESRRVLQPDGCFFLHLDCREVHYAKVLLDQMWGREKFLNEIIWAYDYGARSKTKWPAKHDNILCYVMDPKNYHFNYDAMERIPYMAPGLVGAEKAARGKTPTDCHWGSIVPTNGKEKTGYPTQKPLWLLERLIKVHTKPGDIILDFFAGAGTTGAAAKRLDRKFILVDNNKEAIEVMKKRLQG